ncbi:TrkA domain protein [hydrothermal vent metagenome]|uniref:TrkA domain protein n=1 Tax=hydrothermal vent metagenome TaxID=652676 RepID=A0A3B1DXD9_9ZZZZ
MIILDGIIAKKLLYRIIETNTRTNIYDIIYSNDYILPEQKPTNFTFYKFDPTSFSKLKFVLDKVIHSDTLVVLNNKNDTLSVIDNIKNIRNNLYITVYDNWDLNIKDEKIHYYKGNEILANGLLEQLPNIPVLAQNIGLKQGEIMEIKIPFGSSYAYRYVGSIAQKDWKIFALYRNQILVNVKPSLVLKPNDIILIIGKPLVLTQVYSAISRATGHFPMPFGNNIYVYCDLLAQTKEEVVDIILKAKILHQRMKNKELIVKITNPTTAQTIHEIKGLLEDLKDFTLEIDYINNRISDIITADTKRFDIGLIILTKNLLKYTDIIVDILELKIPIFKVGEENIHSIENTLIILNDIANYKQLSPIVFDIAGQLKFNIKIFNMDPVGGKDQSSLLGHLESLSKIFNQKIKVISSDKNPIKELEKEKNIIQILPLRRAMFKKRYLNFLTTDSDLLAFDLTRYNQILIPIIED